MIQRITFARLALVAVAVLGALGVATASGCGTSCPEIVQQREAFATRERTTVGADARLGVPYAVMDRVIAGQLARRPPVPIDLKLPAIGVPLALELALERVTMGPADDDRVGLTLHMGLDTPDTKERLLALEVDTAVAPTLVREGALPEVAIALRPKDVGELRLRTTADGRARLGRWLRARLPKSLAAAMPDTFLDPIVQSLLDLLSSEAWPLVRERVLGKNALVDARLRLPDLPVDTMRVRSGARGFHLDLTTHLPEADVLQETPDAIGERLVLRLSGGTAMGLVNRAMDRGDVPSRFDGEGKPKADGAWEVRLGWRGGSSPLLVHLWRTRDACKHAEVAARLGLALEGDSVRVSVRDGRLVSVAGPAFAEAFGWIEMLFGKALSATFDTPAFVRFDAGDDVVQLRLARAQLGERDLLLELDLGVAPR